MPFPTTQDLDPVDQASADSFPASDPPARGSFHAAPSETTVCPPGMVPDAPRFGLKRIGLGVAALGAMLSFVEGMRRVRKC